MNTKESKVAIWVKIENYLPAEIDIEGSKSLSDLANAILTNPETESAIQGMMTFHYTADGEAIEPKMTIEEVKEEMTRRNLKRLIVKPVLINQPESGPVGVFDETKLQIVVEKALEAHYNKRSVCSISKVNPEIWTKIIKSIKSHEFYITFNEPKPTYIIPSFIWDLEVAEDNSKQRESYMKYLSEYCAYVRCSTFGHFFKEILIKCGTDVIIVDMIAVKILDLRPGMRIVIEIKKEIKEDNVSQVKAKLIPADLLSSHSVVALLTNLNNYWLFCWMEKKKLVQVLIEHPGNAAQFIKQIFSEGDWKEGFNIPLIGRQMKRMKVEDFVPLSDNEAMEDLESF